MRRLFVALLALALSPSVFAQAPKSDAGREGLKGKVRSVAMREAALCSKAQKEAYPPLLPCNKSELQSEPYLTEIYNYDEQGNYTEQVKFTYAGQITRKSLFKIIDGDKTRKDDLFDEKGNLIPPSQYLAPVIRDTRYNYKYKYSYDGNKVETSIYDSYGSGGYLFSRSIVIYDEKGNHIRYESFENRVVLSSIFTWVYDAQGNEAEKTVCDGKGNIVIALKYTDYKVDSRSNWLSRKVWERHDQQTDFAPRKIELRTIAYYDDPASKQ
jgi:hypothetical protein